MIFPTLPRALKLIISHAKIVFRIHPILVCSQLIQAPYAFYSPKGGFYSSCGAFRPSGGEGLAPSERFPWCCCSSRLRHFHVAHFAKKFLMVLGSEPAHFLPFLRSGIIGVVVYIDIGRTCSRPRDLYCSELQTLRVPASIVLGWSSCA